MIEGWGIAVDAVVSDFLAGAGERLVVEGATRGDLLFVEGQGSILHPQFSGVTLGLYHGSAPHALVLVPPRRGHRDRGRPGHPIPPLPELIELYERLALPVRPAKVAAVALNTGRLDEAEARAAIAATAEETGLPPTTLSVSAPTGLLDAVLATLPSGISGPMNDPESSVSPSLFVDYSLALARGRCCDRQPRRGLAARPRALRSCAPRRRAPVHERQPRGPRRGAPPPRLRRAAHVSLADPVGGDRAARRARDHLVGDEHALALARRPDSPRRAISPRSASSRTGAGSGSRRAR